MELNFKKVYKKGLTSTDKTPGVVQLRDTFQTPNYAVDLLAPFIPEDRISWAWEPACGDGRIVKRLLDVTSLDVFASDVRKSDTFGMEVYDFINGNEEGTIPLEVWNWFEMGGGSIITNPPFSIKEKFVEKCFQFDIPFALLINADYSDQNINWVRRGCEKIIPTTRISYITPNVLIRIHEGEVWNKVRSNYPGFTFKDIKKDGTGVWGYILDKDENKNIANYRTIDEVPQELLYKYSSSQFHSMWLTYGLGLGKTETFVDLTPKMKKGNI